MPSRIIKESVTTSCEIDNLSPEEERFFYRLIVVCDDFGRMDARESILRAKCFPLKLDVIKDKDIEKWLTSLAKQGLVIIYQVDDKPYLQMTTWEKHQQKRAKHSKYPAPDDGVIANDFKCNQSQSNVLENREYENTRNEKRTYGDCFEYLWRLYPRKLGKGSVADAQKKKLHDIGIEHLERCIGRFTAHMQQENRPLDKYPYGSTFFNSGYVDYMDENYSEGKPRGQPQPSRKPEIDLVALAEAD